MLPLCWFRRISLPQAKRNADAGYFIFSCLPCRFTMGFGEPGKSCFCLYFGMLCFLGWALFLTSASSPWLLGISVLSKWVWHHGTHRVIVSSVCHCLFSPWTDLAFLQVRVPLEQVSRHVVTKDASMTGWGAVCNRQAARLAGQDVADFTDLSRTAIDTVTQA